MIGALVTWRQVKICVVEDRGQTGRPERGSCWPADPTLRKRPACVNLNRGEKRAARADLQLGLL